MSDRSGVLLLVVFAWLMGVCERHQTFGTVVRKNRLLLYCQVILTNICQNKIIIGRRNLQGVYSVDMCSLKIFMKKGYQLRLIQWQPFYTVHQKQYINNKSWNVRPFNVTAERQRDCTQTLLLLLFFNCFKNHSNWSSIFLLQIFLPVC